MSNMMQTCSAGQKKSGHYSHLFKHHPNDTISTHKGQLWDINFSNIARATHTDQVPNAPGQIYLALLPSPYPKIHSAILKLSEHTNCLIYQIFLPNPTNCEPCFKYFSSINDGPINNILAESMTSLNETCNFHFSRSQYKLILPTSPILSPNP